MPEAICDNCGTHWFGWALEYSDYCETCGGHLTIVKEGVE